MFTRKHYKAIAELFKMIRPIEDAMCIPEDKIATIIKNVRRSQNNGASPDILLIQIESQIADCFKQDNPRFDRIKFYAACTAD